MRHYIINEKHLAELIVNSIESYIATGRKPKKESVPDFFLDALVEKGVLTPVSVTPITKKTREDLQ